MPVHAAHPNISAVTPAGGVAPDPFTTLNAQQRSAVEHGFDDAAGSGPGPLLVIAGAGTGKTATLAHRVARLVAAGTDPRTILLLTFSRRAAAELAHRVERIVATLPGPQAALARGALEWAGTFHAIGARLLRQYADRIGLAPEFTIHDREDSADLLNLLRQERGLDRTEQRFPTKATCLAIYSRCVNTEDALGVVLARDFPWCAVWEDALRPLFADYVAAKQRQAVLDYDDLLLWWAHALAEPALAVEMGARFSHVLVDEYQDTNRLQASIVRALRPDGRGVVVVGDDAQAIYAFRGATVRNILDFPQQYAPPARVVALERNYRSTQPVLEASNAVIALSPERHAKTLFTDRASDLRPALVCVADEAMQARYVAEHVLERREGGLRLKQQAVLFRTASHSAPLEIELTQRRIPFVKFGGLKFLDAAHVKDVLAVLRWAANPRDRVTGFRVLQLVPGVGPRTAARALDAGGAPADFDPPAAAAEAWRAFAQLLDTLRAGPSWPADLDAACAWYLPLLHDRRDDAAARALDLQQLQAIAITYPSRERFLTALALDPPDAVSDEAGPPLLDEDYLVLSTIHSAKGREWNAVTVLNVVDGCLPSDLATGSAASIEEERRLLYVAMTRARQHLELMVPQRFHVHGQPVRGDRHVYASRSRFIPAGLAARFEQRVWPLPDPAVAVAAGGPAIDLAARMRALWQPR